MKLTAPPKTSRLAAEALALAVAYGLCAHVGLQLDAVSGFASLVWPASGVALGAIILRGPALLPGVFLGAFTANYLNDAHFFPALAIGIGNALEPFAAWYALRVVGFNPALKRLRDAIALILIAALGSTLISATVGVTALYFAGHATAATLGDTWRSWWIGNVIGDLTVAPMILVWSRALTHKPMSSRLIESGALAFASAGIVLLVFALPVDNAIEEFSGVYLVYPLLILAAVRFGPRGAVSTGFIVSAVAVVATIGGVGPFAHHDLHRGLFALQMFVGVQSATFLVLGASIGERLDAERAASEARAVAESANRAKSEFLAVMSHELRTPLNAISGYVQLLEMEVQGPLNAAQRDSLVRVKRNGQHLLTLINDVLGFARIETGNLTLNLEPISVADAFEEMDALLRPDVVRTQIQYSAELVSPSITVLADRERLRQILLNVAGNAIKFTPVNGSVRISAERDDMGCVVICVTDTGIGIAPENIAKVFEPFVQAESGRSRNFSGVGLGLSIVRDLVMAMKGDVRLESRVGYGTTVKIKLPEGPRA